MAERTISTLFNVSGRFLRSVHLERDFKDPCALQGYILSDHTHSCLERIAQGLASNSGQRAWRITGDYGSGKSSFALFLAHWFAGHTQALPVPIRQRTASCRTLGRLTFVPVLVTGSRIPLGQAILRGLFETMRGVNGRGKKSRLFHQLDHILESGNRPTDDLVIEKLIEVSNWLTRDKKRNGLLLILDELGKFLEYAAFNPEQQDVYLLQRVAEIASRSGAKPIFVLGLLHQGFSAYADQLSLTGQREWEKVASRFEEIIFNQPIEQVAVLISSALSLQTELLPKRQSSYAVDCMKSALDVGWFGAAPAKQILLQNAPKIYPIAPTVLPVLVRIFRRCGQNERSLFSFLLSNEPFGLQAFAAESTIGTGELYQLHHLYDYVRFHFGHRLRAQSYRSHWNQIDSMIESFAARNGTELKVVKTVGLLNLLNDSDLLATKETIALAVGRSNTTSERKQIWTVLSTLQKDKRILYHRGAAGGFCLWPHSSVDLDHVYEEASKSLGPLKSVTSMVEKYVDPQPIVARRHYIQTGNLRHFDVVYCSPAALQELKDPDYGSCDGIVAVCLCETKEDQKKARTTAMQKRFEQRPEILIAVSPPLTALHGPVQEAQRWEWIASNTPELSTDRFAAEEVSRQREASRMLLEKKINGFLGLRQFSDQMSLEWFRQGKKLSIRSGKKLLSNLSDICDEIYSKAPKIKNELVNRRFLSSAAAGARMRLLERLITNSDAPFLGMDPERKPPEMSIYLSILKAGGIHVESEGSWKISVPTKSKDTCKVLPSLQRIEAILKKQPDSKVSVAALFAELQCPPYGIRNGILPILLTIFAKIHGHEIAFYEEGTFLSNLGREALLRLTKAPDTFEVQYCSIEGVRADLLKQFVKVLNLDSSNEAESYLLDVVRPLCVFVAELPEYVHHTKKLSARTLKVRESILQARDPARLLFEELPKACGHNPFNSNGRVAGRESAKAIACARDLSKALNELRMAYPQLKDRLFKEIKAAFDLPRDVSNHVRSHVAKRAEEILLGVTESRLKAFSLRLLDDGLPDSEWIESVGSYVTAKPPSRWEDADEDLFSRRLLELTERFKRVESAVFGKRGGSGKRTGIRLAVTRSDGHEKQEVVYVDPSESERLRQLQKEVSKILARDGRLGLAAVSRAVWSALNEKE